LRKAPSS
jgi:hypothetical protein